MELTSDNYYSPEANREYLSVSQYKEFMGSGGRPGCEFRSMQILDGKWREAEMSDAMLIGSYVDSYIEGPKSFHRFVADHPEMYKGDGSMYKKYEVADKVINRIKRDRLFMQYLSGEKQAIMTGEIGGAKWKIKMDSYIPGAAIVDLKVVRSITEFRFSEDYGEKIDFVRFWGYDLQGAVYQEIVRQNTGEKLPFFIAAATKEDEPDIEIIRIPQTTLDMALNSAIIQVPKIVELRAHRMKPVRCGLCSCCRHYKVLTEPVWLDELVAKY